MPTLKLKVSKITGPPGAQLAILDLIGADRDALNIRLAKKDGSQSIEVFTKNPAYGLVEGQAYTVTITLDPTASTPAAAAKKPYSVGVSKPAAPPKAVPTATTGQTTPKTAPVASPTATPQIAKPTPSLTAVQQAEANLLKDAEALRAAKAAETPSAS